MNEKPLLLVIDDEEEILKTLKDSLEDENFRVETLADGHKALNLIGKLIPDLIFLDIFMPNCNGLDLLTRIKQEYPQQKVMIISGFGNIPIAIEAVKKGALDFIEKPLNLDEILSKTEFLKKEYSGENKNNSTDQINNSPEKYGIIGKSFLFLELMQQVTKIAKLDFPVIIYGQHGVGKTIIAKYIHKISSNAKFPFYTINCSSLNYKNEIEKIFELDTSSIYLKNIHDLQIDEQKKLLYKIENQKNKKIRLIASSTISLFNLCKENKFNSSLYYKLNVTPIEIPSLEKRRYDIPILIDYFLKTFTLQTGKQIILNSRSVRLLRNSNWKGNVAELKQLIEKIVLTTKEEYKVISAEDIANYLNEKEMIFIEEQSFCRFNSLKEATSKFEKIFLLYLLRKNRYDLNQVCDRLNLTHLQLKDKILKLNLELKI